MMIIFFMTLGLIVIELVNYIPLSSRLGRHSMKVCVRAAMLVFGFEIVHDKMR